MNPLRGEPRIDTPPDQWDAAMMPLDRRPRHGLAAALLTLACASLSLRCGGGGSQGGSSGDGGDGGGRALDASAGCVPGTSIACAGPGGCTGYQVCSPAGTAFNPCMCGATDSGPLDSTTLDAGDTGSATDGAGADSNDAALDAGHEASIGPAVLRGAIQKGPFILGSSVTLSTIDGAGSPTGQVFNTQTTDDLGAFGVSFTYRGYVDLQAQGFYYDEVTGALSTAPITLRALYDVASGGPQAAYVNIVTHLAHARALALMAAGASTLEAAEAQAEGELVTALGIGGAFNPGSSGVTLNEVGGDTDANAYLFAVSAVLVQAARESAAEAGSVDATLQELLDTIASGIAGGGALPPGLVAGLRQAERDLDVDLTMDLFVRHLQAIGSSATPADLNRAIDSDGDGYRNAIDTCPLVANPSQATIPAGVMCKYTRHTTFAPAGATFTAAPDYTVTPYPIPGDFARTGHPGALGYFQSGATGAWWLFNGDGTGRFATPTSPTLPVPFGPTLPFDVDQDGKLDLLGLEVLGGVSVPGWAAGDGAGRFGAFTALYPAPDAGLGDVFTVGADFNGDGLPDLAGIMGSTWSVGVALATSPGVFAAPVLSPIPILTVGQFTGPAGDSSLLLGDVNGDGVLDLVTAGTGLNGSGTPPLAAVAMLGDGTGAFHASVPLAFPTTSSSYVHTGTSLGDFDGDGHVDVAAWDVTSGSFSIGFGDGTGSFGTTGAAVVTSIATQVVVGDFNADGKTDLAEAYVSPCANVVVLLSAGRTFSAPGPLRAFPTSCAYSGYGSYKDGLIFPPVQAADANGDGTPDLVYVIPDASGTATLQTILMNYLQ